MLENLEKKMVEYLEKERLISDCKELIEKIELDVDILKNKIRELYEN